MQENGKGGKSGGHLAVTYECEFLPPDFLILLYDYNLINIYNAVESIYKKKNMFQSACI